MLEKIWAWIVLNPTLSLGIAGIIGGVIEGARRAWNRVTARSEANKKGVETNSKAIADGMERVEKCFDRIDKRLEKMDKKIDANEKKNAAEHKAVMKEISEMKADLGFVRGCISKAKSIEVK